MLSFESSTSAPEGKVFFLGALAGLAKTGISRVARVGAGATRIARASASKIVKSPIKSLGGVTLSPSFQKTNNNSNTTTNDYSTNSTINYNK